ncbi:MAG: RNA methyltransferase, TrmH family, group 3 [candidate division TM6 bacterium GW2011_GWE2_41_16]|nr:MAG: RNA methyltransferase, TrmH family, group 3 [candidate division TM6 bacterium GW2011_GWE2_41_16]
MAKDPKKIKEMVYGVHSVRELLSAKKRFVHEIYTLNTPIDAWHDIAPLINPATRIAKMSRDQLAKVSGTTDHQGIIAMTDQYKYRSRFFDSTKEPLIVLLDRIQDPRNTGAIIRSAWCAGADGVILIDKGGVDVTAVVHKSSAGLVEKSSVYRCSTVANALQELTKAGYNLYCGDFGGVPVQSVSFTSPCCVVVGNEGLGVASPLLKASTVISIPQRSGNISYNASVAAGIMLVYASVSLGKI